MKKSIKLTQIRGGLNFGGQRKETKRKQSQRNLVAKRISGPGPCATTSTTRTPPTTLRPPRHARRQLCGSVLCGMPQELRPLIDLCHVPQLCCILPLPPVPLPPTAPLSPTSLTQSAWGGSVAPRGYMASSVGGVSECVCVCVCV